MLLDSSIERKIAVYSNLGIPRWHHRINHYLFKIRHISITKKKLDGIPNMRIRLFLSSPYFNEYEVYSR